MMRKRRKRRRINFKNNETMRGNEKMNQHQQQKKKSENSDIEACFTVLSSLLTQLNSEELIRKFLNIVSSNKEDNPSLRLKMWAFEKKKIKKIKKIPKNEKNFLSVNYK